MLKHITPTEAVKCLLDLPVRLQKENIRLRDAYGRVLAEDITAVHPVPPFDRSPFDGYALRSADTLAATEKTPVILRLTEEIAAGSLPAKEIAPGMAAKILTGAPVPRGADCAVKYELTQFTGTTVTISRPLSPGNIIPAGEDVAAGTVINSGVLGVLAGQGYGEIPVWRQPRVAILSTGSELVETGRELPPGKIYSTNFYTLGGLLREAGALPEDGRIVPDDPMAIAEAIRIRCSQADMVLMTGGASAGDYDFAWKALELAGAKLLFRKVDCRPGGAMLAGMLDGKPVLCLSGSAGAAAVGLLRVGIPYVRKLCGRTDLQFRQFRLALRRPYEKASPQTRFIWGSLLVEDGQAFFELGNVQGSSGVSSLARCGLLAEIPAGTPPLPAGALVRVHQIRG